MTQFQYIAILFDDCGYNTAVQRKAWLKLRFGVEYPDELGIKERSQIIDMLKEEKESKL